MAPNESLSGQGTEPLEAACEIRVCFLLRHPHATFSCHFVTQDDYKTLIFRNALRVRGIFENFTF